MPAQQTSSSPSTSLPDWIRRLLLILRRAREKNGILLMVFKGGRLVYFRLARRVRRLLLHRQYSRRVHELIQLIEQHEGFFDLLHVPFGWNTPMFQRYQHLSIQFARLGGFVLYGGHPDVDQDLFVYQVHSKNLYVFDATDRILVKKILLRLRQKKQPKMVRIQSIDLQTTLSDISQFVDLGFVVIYEYIDVISPVITGIVPGFVSSRHTGILADNRIFVLATADLLMEEVRKIRTKNCLLSTNGVDVEHWRKAQAGPPNDLKHMLSTGRTIVGYHGALAEWIDYDLLRAIVSTGKYELLLLGLEHDSSYKESGLAAHPQVHFLGSRSYFELNTYAQYYDIAILPFKKNQLTDSISPVKIFEYMAAQKPVVTTDLLECEKYASCLVSRSTKEFMDNLDLAKNLKADPQYLSLLDVETRANSWHQKTVDILKFTGVLQD
jgi:glycosyltransferase involved in cell wall biosynthesis